MEKDEDTSALEPRAFWVNGDEFGILAPNPGFH
jgi:hypothetical protein